ncbi:MAG: DNA-binding response regulator [Gammaproteobacteria bacterium]|nr:MAG: DNA-binding response regulator [Gammaproteobacteria bacterium]
MRTAAARRTDPLGALLADDHPVVRKGLRECLESSGRIRVVAEVGDGEAAYQTYKDVRPDVVVLDLVMPGISGFETIRRIRRFDPEARILVFSAHDQEAFRERARQAGANGYLTKGEDPERIIEGVLRAGCCASPQDWVTPQGEGSGKGNRRIRQLTLREFEIFQLLARGHSTAEVANLLNISVNTVGVHKTRIMHKLGVSNGAQLALFAIRHGIIRA